MQICSIQYNFLVYICSKHLEIVYSCLLLIQYLHRLKYIGLFEVGKSWVCINCGLVCELWT